MCALEIAHGEVGKNCYRYWKHARTCITGKKKDRRSSLFMVRKKTRTWQFETVLYRKLKVT